MVINRQSRVRLDLGATRRLVRRLGTVLALRGRRFDVGLVDDREIRRLNGDYRGKRRPTDVLSFPWSETGPRDRGPAPGSQSPPDFAGFLGDVIISAQTARRQARAAGHSTENEVFRLILHGVLHLLGYDHETDHGEMTSLELVARAGLGIAGPSGSRPDHPAPGPRGSWTGRPGR